MRNSFLYRTKVTAVLLSSLLLTACNLFGGNDAAVTGTALTGSVVAPAAALASLERPGLLQRMLAGLMPAAYAQTSGLAPVANANLFVFRIDNAGNPVGGIIAQTTTDANGNWSLTLPVGISLASDLIAQATTSSAPRPVGQGGQQNCPATTPTIGLSPATEYATRALIARIAFNSSTLGNFTNAELNAIIGRIIAIAQDPNLVGATIQETIDKITAAADPETKRNLDGASSAGEATAPAGLGGTYNIVSFSAEDQGSSLQRSQESGTVTIDVAAKTFSLNLNSTRAQLSETCQATPQAPCARQFVRSTSSKIETDSGGISLLSGNQIAFQPDDPNSNGALGSYTSNGELIVISSGDGLIIAIKQTASAPPLSGSYQGAELNSQLNDSFNVTGPSTFSTGKTSTAQDINISVASGTVSGDVNDSVMEKRITCNNTGGACAPVEQLLGTSSQDSFSAGISVSSTGIVTVTPPQGQGAPLSGATSSDGNVFALANGHPATDGDAGLILGVKKSTSAPTLSGTYNFTEFSLGLSANQSEVVTSTGTVTLTNGTLNANLLVTSNGVSSNCNGGSCPAPTTSENNKVENPSAGYTVSSTGAVTLTDTQGSTITGFASPDGSIIVLTQVSDGTIGAQNNSDSQRGMFVLIK